MRNLFTDFFSHKALFYDLFNKAGKNLTDMAALLVSALESKQQEEHEQIFKHINTLESVGDDLTHKVYLALDKVYFTPFNRRDIYRMVSAIDDVADYIHEASGRLQLYQPNEFIPDFARLASYVLKACTELELLISQLINKKDVETLLISCRQIKSFEDQADTIYYHAIAHLFANERNAIELIKYRDILHSLETSVNKCKSVTNIIESILLNK